MSQPGVFTPKDPKLAPLFAPLSVGDIDVPNRVFMAPLTRNRAQADGTPAEMAVEYYRQRAGAGLIISEATQISAMGKGYLDTPGIHEEAHVEAWKKITDAVHDAGGHIVLQLWHVGRISHSSLLPDGAAPLAPSAIKAEAMTFTANGFEPTSAPEAMTLDDIRRTIDDYANAAANAIKAGFDGVEIHGANGYLINQFIADGSNTREDDYGGSIENRLRFLREVTEAVTSTIPAGRTGIRLSPYGKVNDLKERDPQATFSAAIAELNRFDLAYLHFVERFGPETSEGEMAALAQLAREWNGLFIPNGRFSAEEAANWIEGGKADAVSFGKPFISNPDLPARFAAGVGLNPWHDDTFYGGGAEGYTDYPAMS